METTASILRTVLMCVYVAQVTEKYSMNGDPSTCKRRDLRRGALKSLWDYPNRNEVHVAVTVDSV